MTKQLIIRNIGVGDIPLLEKHMRHGPSDKHRNRLERQNTGEVLYLAAFAEGIPVGHVLIKWDGTRDEAVASRVKECPDLEDLLVLPEYRKQGIGQKLLREAEQLAVRRGFHQVGLGVGNDNVSARRLYHRLGYRDSGLGEFEVGGTFEDEDGKMRTWHEICVYLIRVL